MTRSAEAAAQAAKIAELKQLIKTSTFETLEKLEEAVDAFLWADDEDAETDSQPVKPASRPEIVRR